jgi:hypothetical protein
MSADKEVTSKLVMQGDNTGLVSAMQKAEAQVKMFEGSVANVSGTLGKLTGVVGMIGAVLAGGAMFKDVVNETNKWTGEAMKLSKMLGITTEEASVLNLALGDVYLTMEDMTAGSAALTKNTLKNKEVYEHYGIALKDANGQQRSTLDIMTDVNAKLLTVKEGRDREIAGLQLYGKGWNDARGLLKLTAEAMDDARKKAEELHIIVGPEAVARTKAYKAAMNDVEDIFMSMKIQVGNQLLPILTNLGVWFNDVGPTALFLFEGALKGIMTFVHSVTLGVNILWEVWKSFWAQFSATSQSLVGVVSNVLLGDFKQAADWAKWGWGEVTKAGETGFDNIVSKATATNEQLQKLWGLKQPRARAEKPSNQTAPVDPYDKEANSGLMAAEDARLKAVLSGIKSREQAEKEGAATSIVEWEYFYKTGTLMELAFQEEKNRIEKAALENTIALIGTEISEIEKSRDVKIGLAKNGNEQEKIRQDSKKEAEEKKAERAKLYQELYRLDVQYQTDTDNLKTQKLIDDNASLGMWAAIKAENYKLALDQEREFLALQDEMRGSALSTELLRIDREALAREQSWAMNTDSFAVYEARMTQITIHAEQQRTKAKQQETSRQMQLAAGGFGSMASIADSFYQLSGKKSKEAFVAYQVMKSGETVISTADAAMKAYSSMASIPYVGPALGAAAAAAAVMAGAVQLQSIWSASPEGGGTLASVSGGGVSAGASDGLVTQPVAQQTQTPAQYTIVLNNPIGERRWFEDNLPDILKDMKSRNIDAGVAYA